MTGSNYDPPSKANWCYTNLFMDCYATAYREGYLAARKGVPCEGNPYQPSGHERVTLWDDDMNHFWFSGHLDGCLDIREENSAESRKSS